MKSSIPASTATSLLVALSLAGVACADKSPDSQATTVDRKPPVERELVAGVDVSQLEGKDQRARFRALVDALPSPCGQAHSLRASLAEDSACKRAPFAARLVVELLVDEKDDAEIRSYYQRRFSAYPPLEGFALDASVPHKGPLDAPVKLVEFYDYGCAGCKQVAPILDQVVGQFPDQVVLFYKQFPLSSHPLSRPAAQAALAAMKQGKFLAMHELLFANQPRHNKGALDGYAAEIGLDMDRFNADFEEAATQVAADRDEGRKLGVGSTPTLFINNQKYRGLYAPKYIAMWIEEALASSSDRPSLDNPDTPRDTRP